MPRPSSSLPEYSWLNHACRPTPQEVDFYAHLIANAEGYLDPDTVERLHREAELQLWMWRSENNELPQRRRKRRTRVQSSDAASRHHTVECEKPPPPHLYDSG